MESKAKPEYSHCVDITTKDALREMALPFDNLTTLVPAVRTQVVKEALTF